MKRRRTANSACLERAVTLRRALLPVASEAGFKLFDVSAGNCIALATCTYLLREHRHNLI